MSAGSDSKPVDCIIQADNLALLGRLPDEHCDLIYIDPPFHTGRKLSGNGKGPHAYDDRFAGGRDGYLSFLRPRLVEMKRVLSPRGTLYIHLDYRSVHYVKVMLDEVFGERSLLNEIIWSYRTGGRAGPRFARKHDTILSYVKNPGSHTFHPLRGGAYRTDGLRWDDVGRPFKTTRHGRLYFDPQGPALTDVWEIPFLSTVSAERTGFPTQKPLELLRRIVRASSNAGDLVADFFCGSGTTLVAACLEQRRWLGCDIAPKTVALARRRIKQTQVGCFVATPAPPRGPSGPQPHA